MREIRLKIENISKKINGKFILNNINLEAEKGEVLGLLGPNGAGKTTLMKIILNLMSPTSGKVYVNSVDIHEQQTSASRHIGAMIEHTEMYPFLSAYNNLVQLSFYSGIRPKKKELIRILEMVGLGEVTDKKVKTFSLGMKQRLGLAQTLVHNPKILLLDEPTNGMDPIGVREFRTIIHDLTKKHNKTVIISSHLLNEMELLCDRVAFIANGELKFIEQVSSVAKQSNNKNMICIEVSSPTQAQEIVHKLEGIEYLRDDEECVYVEVPREEIPQLISELLNNQVSVYAVRNVQSSLEDLFLKLTQEETLEAPIVSRANQII